MYFTGLRKLYGRTGKGDSNRQNIKLTITPETMDMVLETVEFGKGKDGSALFELSVRLLIALVNNGEDLEYIAAELNQVIDSPYIANNLRTLANYFDV